MKQGGTVVGWGSNTDGELGGTTTEARVPIAIKGLKKITQVSEGSSTTVALNEAGTVYALGLNEHGQLGWGSLGGPEKCGLDDCSRSPVAVSGLSKVGGISAGVSEIGEGHALAWLKSGSAPKPEFTIAAGRESITVSWTFQSEEFKTAYRVAPEISTETEPTEKWIRWELEPKTCPCSTTITGLTPGQQYEVRVVSLIEVEEKRKTEDSHSSFATPE